MTTPRWRVAWRWRRARYDAPEFVGDAVADPLAGLAAAVVAVRLARARRAGLVDVAMAGVVNRAVFPPREALR